MGIGHPYKRIIGRFFDKLYKQEIEHAMKETKDISLKVRQIKLQKFQEFWKKRLKIYKIDQNVFS